MQPISALRQALIAAALEAEGGFNQPRPQVRAANPTHLVQATVVHESRHNSHQFIRGRLPACHYHTDLARRLQNTHLAGAVVLPPVFPGCLQA